MSTPTEKPLNQMDPFALASHEAHEHAGSEHHPAENDSEPTHSPYAPTRAREPASAAPISQENAYESVLSRYAPKKARAQQFQGLDVATNEEVASLVAPHASERPRGRPERDAVATDERYVGSRDSDPRRRVQPSPQHKHSAITRPDEGLRDLKRLEAALRWIQREDAAGRIPSAAQLPPVSGLAAADARGRLRDTEMLELRPPRSLEPERMAPPPTKRTRRHRLRVPLMVLLLGTDRILFLDGRLEPTLTAWAGTENDVARSDTHCAVIRRSTTAATTDGPRRRSDVGPGRGALTASGDAAATEITRRRDRRGAAAEPDRRSGSRRQ